MVLSNLVIPKRKGGNGKISDLIMNAETASERQLGCCGIRTTMQKKKQNQMRKSNELQINERKT